MHPIAYNALRVLILESASVYQQELGRINFNRAADLLGQWFPQAAASHEPWHEELLRAIASVQNPLCLGRQEFRAKKDVLSPTNCSPNPAASSKKSPTMSAIVPQLKRVPFIPNQLAYLGGG